MVGWAGDIGPDVAAERLIKRIEQLNLENSGGFGTPMGKPCLGNALLISQRDAAESS